MENTMANFFDAWLLRLMDAWLEENVHGDTARSQVRAAMLSKAEEDPEDWSGQCFSNLYDHAKCHRIAGFLRSAS